MRRMLDARTGLEVIDPDECRRLLAGDEIGRLAMAVGGTPTVFPVNYVMDGDAVVFRTAPGTKLAKGPRSRVAFEVDHFDKPRRTGWSVVVTGRLEEVTRYDAAAYERLRALPLNPWAEGEKAHVMRLRPDQITGRRIVRD